MAAGWMLSAPDRGVLFGGHISPAQLNISEFHLSESSVECKGRIVIERWKSDQRVSWALEG